MEENARNSILIIENNKAISNFIKRDLVSDMDVDVFQVFSYDEAKELLEKKSDFFVAVMGLVLKNTSRRESVDYVLSKGIPSIVLTGTLDEQVRSEILSKNVIDYVVKRGPESAAYVKKLISRLCMNQSIKALVVDDSDVTRKHYKELLGNHRYQVLEAENGNAALKKLKEHGDIKLAIADYRMPRMDGVEIVTRIRNMFGKSEMIVIGISANGDSLLYPQPNRAARLFAS